MGILPGLPMPLCDRELQQSIDHIRGCEECRAKLSAFLNLPIIRSYIPDVILGNVDSLMQSLLKGKSNGESAGEDRGG